jgi:aspartyl-tRNA(Asn)/glutamyl-tRNA(Gln) amidotransferase subunit A
LNHLMPKNYDEVRSELFSGKTRVLDIVKYYLTNISKGKHLNAFLSIFQEEAIQQAKQVDEKIKKKSAGKLAGMVTGIKDVLSIKGKTMTCASKILENFTPLYTCTAVQRLIDEDAVIIGKTNCDEFAMGSSNENSAYGVVRNPVSETRVPGGSSGGSAVAVAADMCMTSLGTDTGGSVRQPAAFCGVVGIKPTYGRVSRYGLTAFASSFDTIGVFANNVKDCARVLEVIAGWDKMDSTSVGFDVPKYAEELSEKLNPKDFTIGLIDEFMEEGLQAEIKNAILNKLDCLKSKGFKVKTIHLPHLKYSVQAYYILITAEASSNLARYDGARYGFRDENSKELEDMYVNSRTKGFGTEVKRRIMLGTYVLSAGYYDAYYRKAQKARRLIKEDFTKAFKEVDLIIGPTTPTTAFKIGEKIDDPLEMYLTDIYTTSSNLAGIPAISIPVAKDKSGLPIGIQIMGNDFDELNVLKFADYITNNC